MKHPHLAVLVLCGALTTPALAQAQPPQPGPQGAAPAARKSPSAVLRGQVLGADTGAGLTRARVAVVGEGSRETPRIATTDSAGRWEVGGLPAGRYVITVSRPPYVTLQYGQRVPVAIGVFFSGLPVQGTQTAGRPVEVADGQVIEQIDVKLQRCAVIAGRVTDDLGEPVAYKPVNAMRLQYFEGRRQMVRAGFRMQTNDLGEFRLYGLPAGTYYLMTESVAWPSALPEDEGPSFATTFHPSGTTPAAAQPITVRAGQERLGADIRLAATRLARVSGSVVDAEGAAVMFGTVTLEQDTRSATGLSGTRGLGNATIQNGRFTLTGVAPGEYFLQALRPTSGPGSGPGRGLMPLTVSGQNIDGLVLALMPGSTVVGQIEFDGEEPPVAGASSARVRADEPVATPFASAGVSVVAADWSFELKGVSPGRRVFRASGLPAAYALKAVYIDGEDVTDVPRAFDGKDTLSGVRVVVSRRVSAVSGSVMDEQGKEARDYSVVIFSAEEAQWAPGSRRRAVGRPDQYGRFTVSGLPPGDYFAIALDALMSGEGEDPEVLAEVRDRAVRFTLSEGGHQSLALKLNRLDRQ